MLDEFWREGYWQHLVSTARRFVQHSRSYTRCFAPCFWRSHYQSLSWCCLATQSCDLTLLDYYLWGAVQDKCYADKSETIDALKDNIRKANGEIQLRTIDNVLKIWTDCMASRDSHWIKLFSIINRKIALSNKKVFFKHFPKKKNYLADPVWHL